MAIPDHQTLMLPLLQLAADGSQHRVRDAVEELAARFGITAEKRAELLPSGIQPVFDNRVGWARTYLKKAGLLNSPKRGFFQITQAGQQLLHEQPEHINVALLDRYESFREFKHGRTHKSENHVEEVSNYLFSEEADNNETPEEALASAYQKLQGDLEYEILEQIKAAPPAFFERLVIDLLVAMGYGGSRQDAGRAIGRSGDGGIDGIINEDRLGLDTIYVQAKRWEGTVGRPEIQKFAGAVQGQRAHKGVFMTTSSFSREAREYADNITSRIILINGSRLAALMIDYNIGVSRVGLYELKRIDSDYFEGA